LRRELLLPTEAWEVITDVLAVNRHRFRSPELKFARYVSTKHAGSFRIELESRLNDAIIKKIKLDGYTKIVQ